MEKASLRDREYESFKVKKQSDLRPDEVEHDKQLMEKFNKLSDKEKGKIAHTHQYLKTLGIKYLKTTILWMLDSPNVIESMKRLKN